MKTCSRSIAAVELLLVAPAALFMSALFVRNLQPNRFEPARSAQQIVNWFAARPHLGLWGLLIGLPCAVMLIGCPALLHRWRSDGDLRLAVHRSISILREYCDIFLIAFATSTAGIILAIVALHLISG
jgi:hypothetical protein